MQKIIKKHFNLLFIFLVIVLAIPSVLPLLHAGFPLTDDGNWMVIRSSAFYESLRAGQFPVRFLMRLNNGYGYPVADFLYPLFMYLVVPLHLLVSNFVESIKLVLILSLISSSVFCFLWLRKLFDNISSLAGSVFYAYFPYHLFDVYKRGSVGEVLSLVILPFILWQIERKNLVFVSIGIALLITAHNTLALLFIPFILFYSYIRNSKISKFNLLTLLFGFGISAFFWVPAFYDAQFTVFANTSISNFSSYFINNNLGILGVITAFLVLDSAFYLIRSKDKFFSILFLTFLAISFFTLSFSEVIWKVFPFTNLIQFPFRLISLLIPLGAFMVAYLLNKEKTAKKYILVVVYLILIFFSSYAFLFPKSFQYLPDAFYSTNQDTTTVKNEYMPKWVKVIPSEMYKSKVEVLNSVEVPKLLVQNANKTSFDVDLSKSKTIRVNTIYFPGWQAFVNGKKTNISYNNPNGVMQLNLEKGQNHVEFIFGETPIRILADLISIISIVFLFGFHFFIKNSKSKLIL